MLVYIIIIVVPCLHYIRRNVFSSGLLSPNSQHSYYNLPYPPGAMPPYPYSGYEFAQTHPRPWNSPPPFPSMPPPVAQLGPPFWQTRQEGSRSDVSNIVRKRQRRASSRSSNGGNSDTGYTSGLSSPAHASPGQNKLQEKAENLFKSKVCITLIWYKVLFIENIFSGTSW